MPQRIEKDPEAKLPYGIKWGAWLVGDDTIDESTWTVPAGITKMSDTNTDTIAIIWLEGGTAGAEYELVNHIKSVGGYEDDRTLTIVMTDK